MRLPLAETVRAARLGVQARGTKVRGTCNSGRGPVQGQKSPPVFSDAYMIVAPVKARFDPSMAYHKQVNQVCARRRLEHFQFMIIT